jgi:hypothetical protein
VPLHWQKKALVVHQAKREALEQMAIDAKVQAFYLLTL